MMIPELLADVYLHSLHVLGIWHMIPERIAFSCDLDLPHDS
jgi:hypothetical protein